MHLVYGEWKVLGRLMVVIQRIDNKHRALMDHFLLMIIKKTNRMSTWKSPQGTRLVSISLVLLIIIDFSDHHVVLLLLLYCCCCSFFDELTSEESSNSHVSHARSISYWASRSDWMSPTERKDFFDFCFFFIFFSFFFLFFSCRKTRNKERNAIVQLNVILLLADKKLW